MLCQGDYGTDCKQRIYNLIENKAPCVTIGMKEDEDINEKKNI